MTMDSPEQKQATQLHEWKWDDKLVADDERGAATALKNYKKGIWSH